MERRSMVEQYLRRSAELLREYCPSDDTARDVQDEMLALAIQLDLIAADCLNDAFVAVPRADFIDLLEFIEDQEDVTDGSDGRPQANRALHFATVLRPLVKESAAGAHTDHPLRHYDRTCPACVADAQPADAIALLREWKATEMDSMDEEFQPWLDSFTKRVDAVLAAHPDASMADKRDAERYRTLRDLCAPFRSWKVSMTHLDDRERPERLWLHGEQLDAAIDAEKGGEE